jgi:hypothetical protein
VGRSSLYRPAASSAKTVTGTGIGSQSGLGEEVMSGESGNGKWYENE